MYSNESTPTLLTVMLGTLWYWRGCEGPAAAEDVGAV